MGRRTRRRLFRVSATLRLTSVLLLVGAASLFLIEMVAFSQAEDRLPADVIVAGIDVGGMSTAEAQAAWEQAFAQPLTLYYNNSPIVLDPASIGFRLNLQAMIADAQAESQGEGSYWGRFINYLTQRNITKSAVVPLSATYQRSLLEAFLQDIAARYDQPPGRPGFDTATLTTFAGDDGFTLDIEQSVQLIDAALANPRNRVVQLPVGGTDANQPTLDTLRQLIITYLDSEGFIFDGQTTTASVFVLDLTTGEELNLLGDVAFSAASTQKVSLLVEYFRLQAAPPSQDDAWLLANSLLCSDNSSSNLIIERLIGGGNIFNGLASINTTLSNIGLGNSYISAPFAEPGRALGSIEPPSTNPNTDFDTQPDVFNQITASDIGTLFGLIYDCANYGSGLATVFGSQTFTQRECSQMLELMSANDIERLLQGGIQPDVRISHKNGWLNTSAVVGDAGVVFPPSGRDYVIAIFLWQETSPEDATSIGFQRLWPLVEGISRAAWNYFSPQDPLLTQRTLPPTARDCEASGYLPPYGQVNLDDINGWRED